jgi:predicted RNase H-like nuclease (RuvC/YqgF family)
MTLEKEIKENLSTEAEPLKDSLKEIFYVNNPRKRIPFSEQAYHQIHDKFFEITKGWRTIDKEGFYKKDFWEYLQDKLKELEQKQYNQKIKELEKWQVSPSVNDLTDKLIEKENDIERLKHKLLTYSRPIGTSYVDVREEGRKEVNQRWTEKIKELIKHFDFLGSGGDNYAKHVVKKLKSLLENEKE